MCWGVLWLYSKTAGTGCRTRFDPKGIFLLPSWTSEADLWHKTEIVHAGTLSHSAFVNSSLLGMWRMQHRMDLALIWKALSPSLRPLVTRRTTSSGHRLPLGTSITGSSLVFIAPTETGVKKNTDDLLTPSGSMGWAPPCSWTAGVGCTWPPHKPHPPWPCPQQTHRRSAVWPLCLLWNRNTDGMSGAASDKLITASWSIRHKSRDGFQNQN